MATPIAALCQALSGGFFRSVNSPPTDYLVSDSSECLQLKGENLLYIRRPSPYHGLPCKDENELSLKAEKRQSTRRKKDSTDILSALIVDPKVAIKTKKMTVDSKIKHVQHEQERLEKMKRKGSSKRKRSSSSKDEEGEDEVGIAVDEGTGKVTLTFVNNLSAFDWTVTHGLEPRMKNPRQTMSTLLMLSAQAEQTKAPNTPEQQKYDNNNYYNFNW